MATVKDCIFCRIVRGEIPSRKVYEDDDMLAFHDIAPQAPVHFMIIPKDHVESLAAVGPERRGKQPLGRLEIAGVDQVWPISGNWLLELSEVSFVGPSIHISFGVFLTVMSSA